MASKDLVHYQIMFPIEIEGLSVMVVEIEEYESE